MTKEHYKKTIDLREYPYPALILPCESGILFEQQTGGLACSHHQIEGLFLPLPVQSHNLHMFMEALEVIHPGCYGHSLTFEEACKLDDAVIKRYNVPLEVNKEKRGESTEAWVHVRIMGKDDKWPYRPGSSELWDFQRFAKKMKPDITKEEIIQILHKNILECSTLADFAGEGAILTWENCD